MLEIAAVDVEKWLELQKLRAIPIAMDTVIIVKLGSARKPLGTIHDSANITRNF